MSEFKLKITIDGRQAAIIVIDADTREEAMRKIRERIEVSVVGGQEPRGSKVSRRIKSQDVADVVGDPGFQELVAPVSEGVVQQMGEVVMKTVDQIAGPIEEVLDRPLTEDEMPDVQEVATDLIQESLSQVSQGIAETTPEASPVEGSMHRRATRYDEDYMWWVVSDPPGGGVVETEIVDILYRASLKELFNINAGSGRRLEKEEHPTLYTSEAEARKDAEARLAGVKKAGISPRGLESKIKWKQLDGHTWEGQGEKHDFAITEDGGAHILDIFLSSVKDPNKAHVESEEYGSLEEAQKVAEDYK